jgi:hypothetical protein
VDQPVQEAPNAGLSVLPKALQLLDAQDDFA